MSNPKISIAVPVHNMKNRSYFLERLQQSLEEQTYTNFEVVITEEGSMPVNSNAAIKKCTGDIIKILYMDDFLYSPLALEHIAQNFTGGWLATGCTHTSDGVTFFNEHVPRYNIDIKDGRNTIGSPSVIAFENKDPLLFDENLSWMLDCELYTRLFQRYGLPTLLDSIDVAIGIGDHQTSQIMSDEDKAKEVNYVQDL